MQRIITIDGSASCGKSTLAFLLAQRLHYTYLDTGAMYRAMAYACLQAQLTPQSDATKIIKLLHNLHIHFQKNNQTHKQDTYMNGHCIEENIRQLDIAEAASAFATLPFVRKIGTQMQRNMAEINTKNKDTLGIVTEGRDMGSIVFPNAPLKFFLQASLTARAQRRYKELKEKDITTDFNKILLHLQQRDQQDTQRTHSPLRPAPDAHIIDNTHLTLTEQLKIMYEKAQKIFL